MQQHVALHARLVTIFFDGLLFSSLLFLHHIHAYALSSVSLSFLSYSDVLALPIFKQEDSSLPPENETKNPPFQYVLCAATSPAVKLHDETLTYLNQGKTQYVHSGESLACTWVFNVNV